MTKEQRATQRLTLKFFKEWKYRLGLNGWSFDFIWYSDENDEDFKDIFEGKAR